MKVVLDRLAIWWMQRRRIRACAECGALARGHVEGYDRKRRCFPACHQEWIAREAGVVSARVFQQVRRQMGWRPNLRVIAGGRR